MRDLIFVSLEDWDEVWRRNQFICAELADRFPSTKILFVGLPMNISHLLSRGRLSELSFRSQVYSLSDRPNITVARGLKWLPHSMPFGRRLNNIGLQSFLKPLARNMKDPLLWLNPPDSKFLIGKLGESASVYDITDDWEFSENSLAESARIQREDRALCARADGIVVCSEELLVRRKAFKEKIFLLPNGVHYDFYQSKKVSPKIAALRREGPLFGYTGTLHTDRLNVEVLLKLALTYPRSSIALVGPNLLPAKESAKLRACKNIFLTGPLPFSEMPEVLNALDICLVPHKVTSFTQSLNPLKLWEYLAVGTAIVSTPVSGFKDYPDLIDLALSDDDFVKSCGQPKFTSVEHVRKRKEMAQKNSWKTRVDSLLKHLESCVFV